MVILSYEYISKQIQHENLMMKIIYQQKQIKINQIDYLSFSTSACWLFLLFLSLFLPLSFFLDFFFFSEQNLRHENHFKETFPEIKNPSFPFFNLLQRIKQSLSLFFCVKGDSFEETQIFYEQTKRIVFLFHHGICSQLYTK